MPMRGRGDDDYLSMAKKPWTMIDLLPAPP
jgi:hypothetical protein